jgi:hypothetical protein
MRGRLRGTNLDIDEYEFAIADAVMLAQGEIDLAENASSTNLRFSGNVPSLATIGTFDEREFSDQSLAWEGQVIGGSGRLHLDDFQVVLGGSDVFGDVIYEAGEVPELTLSLTSDALVYKPLLEPVEVVDYEPEPVFDDGKLIPDLPIPFDAMAKLNADVDIEVKRLQRGSLLLGNLSFRATLVNGALSIFDTGFNARSGRMDMRASIKPADGIGSANFELVARDFALGMTELNQDLASRGSFDINLASTGNDLRSLAGNIDGVLFVDIRGGRIGHNRFVQALYGDLLDEIVSAINPFYKRDPYTTFECIVLPVAIDNGVVHGEPNSFIATDKVRMTLKSKINLATEKIDVNVRTTPRKTLSISAGELVNPFVKVVGTLARPALAVDETGVLITGGAAVATGGISVLARAAWDRLGGARDKCGATGERGREVLAERFPDLEIRETVADFASAEMPATATDTIVNDVAETESPPK